jgi:hypothetical protein
MIKRSKEQWLSLIQQQADSGISAAAFCKQQNICNKHFCVRKKQLLSSRTDAAFVPVVVQPQKEKPGALAKPMPTSTYVQCRIGSCVLQFESLPDVTWLAQLIKALA